MAHKTHKTCSIRKCGQPAVARGWCIAHYRRWRRYGDPTTERRRPGVGMAAVTAEQAAWLAGVFEGEGCVTSTGGYPGLTLQMTDEDVVRRFAKLVGAGSIIVRPGRLEHHKPLYRWSKTGHRFVEDFYAATKPWLGARRRARLQEALRGQRVLA